MAKRVREPIQVYLTEDERAELDAVATRLGVSRSEVLRRGIDALGGTDRAAGPLSDLVGRGWVTGATRRSGAPPIGAPVAPLDALLAELDEDRGDR